MNREELVEKWSKPQPVGSGGHVRLVDYMGDDAAVVQAARVSYGAGTKTVNEDRGLIRYLMRHRHTTPFEMCEIKLHVRVPMDAWRQWIRHRTASVNEYSTRYSIAIDERATTLPGEWRVQSTNNKQGSNGNIEEWPSWEECLTRLNQEVEHPDGRMGPLATDQEIALMHSIYRSCTLSGRDSNPGKSLTSLENSFHENARQQYLFRLMLNIAREQARKDLPLSTYTEAYWKIDLHNLLHFLALRLDSHAQQEIREFAEAIANIVRDWVPLVWEAFEDYRLGGCNFSATEMAVIRDLISNAMVHQHGEHPDHEIVRSDYFSDLPDELQEQFLKGHGLTNKRERAEFLRKLSDA